MENQNLKTKERKWFLGIMLLTILLVSVSVCYGWIVSNPNVQYVGSLANYRVDFNVYFSYILQAKHGAFLFYNAFTGEQQPALFLAPHWYLLGVLANILDISPQAAFHIGRILTVPILISITYYFIRQIFHNEKNEKTQFVKRITALAVFCFAGGFGFFFMPFFFQKGGNQPIDLLMPEGFPFQTMMHSIHWILAYILIISIMILVIELLKKEHNSQNRKIFHGLLFFLSFFLGIIHPYDTLSIIAVLFVFSIWHIMHYKEWKKIMWIWFSIGSGIGLAALYFFSVLILDTVFKGWFLQNVTLSPPWYQFLAGYGLLVPLTCMGVYVKIKKQNLEKQDLLWSILLFAWLIVSCTLIFIPSEYQRRLVLGLFFPMTIFSTEGIMWILEKLRNQKKVFNTAFITMIIAFLPTTALFSIWRDIATLRYFRSHFFIPYFVPKDYTEAFKWIESSSTTDDIIFASWEISNLIPAQISRKVFFGHIHQTIDSLEKQYWIADTVTVPKVEDSTIQYLQQAGITYIIIGPEEKDFIFRIAERSEIEPAFESGEVKVYRLRSE